MTFDQRGELLSREADLLDQARVFVEENDRITDQLDASAPPPADAVTAGAWEDDDRGGWMRMFEGALRPVGECIVVAVHGTQWSDGRVEREIVVEARDESLSPSVARSVAEALLQAADQVEGLR
ncbi:hypothetical protein [Mycolicibacterium palauense]|uniref:hypothetical protein n=1 Tax=Mycolicibacterium palauense TaxID=2034511 RepID=UPI000BFEE906|nr:hypothetical protein [Mycolicibacterium palauense]